MNNFICMAALDKMARRIAAPIPNLEASRRYTALARHALMTDMRTALPASSADLECAPPWALRAASEGQPVHVFCADPDLVSELRRGARALRDACFEWQDLDCGKPAGLHTRDAMVARFAEELFAKLDRMPLEIVCEKARWVAAERRRRRRAARSEQMLFQPEEIYAAPGRIWRRVVSTAELARVGAEMRNCLAGRSGRHSDYARRLAIDFARFWVLRDELGAALAVVMIRTADRRLLEARAPRNAPITPHDAHLHVLLKACGVDIPPPRPPRPPRHLLRRPQMPPTLEELLTLVRERPGPLLTDPVWADICRRAGAVTPELPNPSHPAG